MPTFDMRCNECGYEGEQILKSHNSSAECPDCGYTPLEKLASFPNVSTSKTRSGEEYPPKIEINGDPFHHVSKIVREPDHKEIGGVYQRDPQPGDAELN